MTSLKIKYDFFLLLILLIFVSSCNSTQNIKTKLINQDIISKNKKTSLNTIIKKNISKVYQNNYLNTDNKVIKKNLDPLNTLKLDNLNSSDVIFEFRNERLLEGRDDFNKKVNEKTNTALTAVFKMLKKNPSLESKNLNLTDDLNDKSKNIINYTLNFDEKLNVYDTKKILVFLPFTGPYSKFGKKIREGIDLSVLNFGSNEIKTIYFDTGTSFSIEEIKKIVKEIKPKLILGPFTASSARKIKPYIVEKSMPMFAFTNNIGIIEKNVWSLGFSPEEQVDSVLSCALSKNYKNFGVIVPDDLYGKVILDRSSTIINSKKNTSLQKLILSSFEMSNKSNLASILKRFLAYNSKNKIGNFSKFDAIFISGNKNFILEISPLLAYYDVDSSKVQILGTEKFNINEIKNEPSLERSWFPIILNKNRKDLNILWKKTWNNEDDYFSRISFDSGILAINFLKQKKSINEYLKGIEGLVTGFKFKENGFVKKSISVMEIEKLGKIKKVKGCLS